jgi:hypothetical protein
MWGSTVRPYRTCTLEPPTPPKPTHIIIIIIIHFFRLLRSYLVIARVSLPDIPYMYAEIGSVSSSWPHARNSHVAFKKREHRRNLRLSSATSSKSHQLCVVRGSPRQRPYVRALAFKKDGAFNVHHHLVSKLCVTKCMLHVSQIAPLAAVHSEPRRQEDETFDL